MGDAPVPTVPDAPATHEVVAGEPNEAHVAMMKKSWDPGTTEEEHMTMMTEVIAEDVVSHNMAEHKKTDSRDAYMEEMQVWSTGFPNAKPELVEAFGVGDYVIARGRMVGKHEGDLPFAKATGKDTTIDMATIVRFEDGKIVEQWEYW